MKIILIPFDGSETSQNTVSYAADLVKTRPVEKIVLLQSFHFSLFAQIMFSADFVQVDQEQLDQERKRREAFLKEACHKLQGDCGCDVQVEYAMTEDSLLRTIYNAILEVKPDLLMIGSDSGPVSSLIGEQVVSIGKTSTVPVLIVPDKSSYVPVKTLLVPCDFSRLENLSPLSKLNRIFSHDVFLRILNIDPRESSGDLKHQHRAQLRDLLAGYRFDLSYRRDKDILGGILDFARAEEVQLIIALPGRHSFFYTLTHSSISQGLSLNGNKPVLLLK